MLVRGTSTCVSEPAHAVDPSLRLYLGASADVSAEADGTGLEGRASVSPGWLRPYIPDEGAATCLRVAGSRAVVGFVSDLSAYGEPPAYLLLYIEDAPAGDRCDAASRWGQVERVRSRDERRGGGGVPATPPLELRTVPKRRIVNQTYGLTARNVAS